MTRKSRLEAGGQNLFQEIKAVCVKAEAAGKKLCRLSIGQPEGPAILEARAAAATAILSDDERMHEYQDNGSPGVPDFAERFVLAHLKAGVFLSEARCFPIPGIKPMLGLIPLACGAANGQNVMTLTTTAPGYPTPAVWCNYLQKSNRSAVLSAENSFRFSGEEVTGQVDLLMTNYPHNPSGQVATKEWWIAICVAAQENNVRIFNDAAYAKLAHGSEHCTLTDVAVDFPDLSWAEAFSASKAGNFTGWRVGAIVGSPDFVDDIATIKGNTDSGFVAPMAAGVLALYEKYPHLITNVQATYKGRLQKLIRVLYGCGMNLAVEPKAGFFTLWQIPSEAFGIRIESAAQFNYLMIERTGVVGVHFDPCYIRYAVCSELNDIERIEQSFREANVKYN